MKVTIEQFQRMADNYCVGICGMGVSDLPDTVFVDDFFEEGEWGGHDLSAAVAGYVEQILENEDMTELLY
jgi:hypothetical protein